MVVLSPPGKIKPAISSNCARSRTYTGWAPARSRAAPCAAKSPCSESTPTFFMVRLPAAGLQQLAFGDLGNVEAGHGFAEGAAGFEEFIGIIEILGGLHDGFGARGGVGGFEDAGAHEDGLGAELHDERGVGGSGDAAGGEVRHREFAVL